MINSRNKGKTGEHELAKVLSSYGYSCVRGQQTSGKGKNVATGQDDVIGLPGIHIECKRVERLNLYDSVEQSARDADPDGKMPVVMHRKNRHKWLVTMSLEDWVELYQGAQCACYEGCSWHDDVLKVSIR